MEVKFAKLRRHFQMQPTDGDVKPLEVGGVDFNRDQTRVNSQWATEIPTAADQ